MAHEYSSIDEMLMQSKPASMPATPEVIDIQQAQESENAPSNSYDISNTFDKSNTFDNAYSDDTREKEVIAEKEPEKDDSADERDEYGNDVPKPRTYTEEEAREMINKAMRERLARMERNNPDKAEAFKKAAQDFEADTSSNEPWEEQLETFIERKLEKISQKQVRARQEAIERQEQAEFEDKFHESREKFSDFEQVVGRAPVTDDMVMASRAFKDPAAFFYAAAKTQMPELERISRIADPYKRVAEIGRLEERMRKGKSTTSAPKPVSHVRGDLTMKAQEKRPAPSIEDMMHAKDREKKAQLQARTRR